MQVLVFKRLRPWKGKMLFFTPWRAAAAQWVYSDLHLLPWNWGQDPAQVLVLGPNPHSLILPMGPTTTCHSPTPKHLLPTLPTSHDLSVGQVSWYELASH